MATTTEPLEKRLLAQLKEVLERDANGEGEDEDVLDKRVRLQSLLGLSLADYAERLAAWTEAKEAAADFESDRFSGKERHQEALSSILTKKKAVTAQHNELWNQLTELTKREEAVRNQIQALKHQHQEVLDRLAQANNQLTKFGLD